MNPSIFKSHNTSERQKFEIFNIYGKPTQTDIIIPNNFCHPHEHKLSGVNCLLNRLHTYPITKRAKETEINTIKNILHNNTNLTLPPQKQHILFLSTTKKKWVTLSYSGKEVRRITKLLKNRQIKIVFPHQTRYKIY
jgi:hypothetical protein